jgi:hypothetical protein
MVKRVSISTARQEGGPAANAAVAAAVEAAQYAYRMSVINARGKPNEQALLNAAFALLDAQLLGADGPNSVSY